MGFLEILLAIISLVAAVFTGNGSVSAAQADALNEASPGLGTLYQTAMTSANGAAKNYTEWAADASVLGQLGFLTPFNPNDGLAGTVTNFLEDAAPILTVGLVVLGIWWFTRDGSRDPRFWRSSDSGGSNDMGGTYV